MIGRDICNIDILVTKNIGRILDATLGSHDPTQPIDVNHFYGELSGADPTLRAKWKKRNLYSWASKLGKTAPPYRESRRSAATSNRILLPVENAQTA